ncbi:MAG: TetR/AcrR family transcriptional regulator, partial [Clostridia bacterium]|nr:TetR/AcrR family transcriptional regulator [Clostridia bacterium]
MNLKNTQNSIKEKRKEKIISSALKVFCEKGYQSATVDDITKKAKCSHGLFYHYFDNKKQLFEQVCALRGNGMMDYLDQVVRMPINYTEKLK